MRSSLLAAIAVLGVSVAVACSSGSSKDDTSSSDIIGGVEATGATLNAIGAVGNKDGDAGFSYFCTATLIAPDLVLTAKHCATEGPLTTATTSSSPSAPFRTSGPPESPLHGCASSLPRPR